MGGGSRRGLARNPDNDEEGYFAKNGVYKYSSYASATNNYNEYYADGRTY